jgi:hypothetical protein
VSRRHLLTLGVIALVGGACDGPDVRAVSATPGHAVDSALPREEMVRRFIDGLPRTDSLTGGAGSRDQLVAAFVRALASADTAALQRMAVSRSEFAYLYYPASPRSKPPYDLEPGLMWFLQLQQSDRGLTLALRRFGGSQMELLGYDCGKGASHEGDNIVYGPCTVQWRRERGDTVSGRLFTQILERDGRFKFLSYANQLD